LSEGNQYILVYDANCGPCSKFRRAVDWFDKYNRLRYLSLEDADDAGVLNSLPVRKRHTSFHLVSPSGAVRSGSDAIPDLISLLPSGSILSLIIRSPPIGKNAIGFVYATLSRLHDSGSCSYESKSRTISSGSGASTLEANIVFLGKKFRDRLILGRENSRLDFFRLTRV
jgi:predicted DCC family thiol-disulfide oxidoreductase YuxK